MDEDLGLCFTFPPRYRNRNLVVWFNSLQTVYFVEVVKVHWLDAVDEAKERKMLLYAELVSIQWRLYVEAL